MTPTVRLLPFETLPGPANMAADEAMLDRAAAGEASLRFYQWSEPTLSLGYFQPAADRLADPKLAALPWVRRASGGAAIVHGDGDLTYALALPPGKPWQGGESWVCRFHHLIRDEFNASAADARMVVCGEEAKLGPTLCFLDHTPGDVRVGGVKVVGSAQRKLKGAVLQHGSIRLRASRAAPQLPGAAELARVSGEVRRLADVLAARFAAATGWAVEPGAWSAAERGRIAELAAGRYASVEWNEKR